MKDTDSIKETQSNILEKEKQMYRIYLDISEKALEKNNKKKQL